MVSSNNKNSWKTKMNCFKDKKNKQNNKDSSVSSFT